MNHEKLLRDLSMLPAPQRRAVLEEILRIEGQPEIKPGQAIQAIAKIAAAAARTTRKRASDRQTDRARRVLVGARLPRKVAEMAEYCAAAREISLYAWVSDAIKAAILRDAPELAQYLEPPAGAPPTERSE